MIEPLRRWSQHGDLTEEEVVRLLVANEPMMGHDKKKNKELLRVLRWALPFYAKGRVDEALARFTCRHDREAIDRAHDDPGYY